MKVKPTHAAVLEGRTVFKKSVTKPSPLKHTLKPANSNTKLSKGGSKFIKKGPWAGMPLYSLTLEERATCPKSCHHWVDCYGNNMYLATRFSTEGLIETLDEELLLLSCQYPDGFVVRLHILGDFYSTEYVKAWRNWLALYPELRIFGYTARKKCNIGRAIIKTYRMFPDRFVVRHSTNDSTLVGNSEESPLPLAVNESYEEQSFGCPVQIADVDDCISCGLCLNPKVTKAVKFMTH